MPESVDYWPGVEAESRPEATFSGGETCGGPGESTQNVVVLQSDPSTHDRKKTWPKLPRPPPASVPARSNGGVDPAPALPLRALGLPRGAVRELFVAADASSWWGESFAMGRAPLDSKYCGVRYALFESFAPLERVPAPVYRHLLRSLRAAAMRCGDPGRADVRVSVGATSAEFGGLLRAYADALPRSVIRAVGAWEESVGPSGSHSARLTQFQALDRVRASRMLRGFRPTPPEAKSAGGLRTPVRSTCSAATRLCGRAIIPASGAFARLPASGGKARRGIARRRGYRVPAG